MVIRAVFKILLTFTSLKKNISKLFFPDYLGRFSERKEKKKKKKETKERKKKKKKREGIKKTSENMQKLKNVHRRIK